MKRLGMFPFLASCELAGTSMEETLQGSSAAYSGYTRSKYVQITYTWVQLSNGVRTNARADEIVTWIRYRIHGKIYHLVSPLSSHEANKPWYGQFYISDSAEIKKNTAWKPTEIICVWPK
jgi:hypothetical protein